MLFENQFHSDDILRKDSILIVFYIIDILKKKEILRSKSNSDTSVSFKFIRISLVEYFLME